MSDVYLVKPRAGHKVKSGPGGVDNLPPEGRVMRMTPWIWRRKNEGVVDLLPVPTSASVKVASAVVEPPVVDPVPYRPTPVFDPEQEEALADKPPQPFRTGTAPRRRR